MDGTVRDIMITVDSPSLAGTDEPVRDKPVTQMHIGVEPWRTTLIWLIALITVIPYADLFDSYRPVIFAGVGAGAIAAVAWGLGRTKAGWPLSALVTAVIAFFLDAVLVMERSPTPATLRAFASLLRESANASLSTAPILPLTSTFTVAPITQATLTVLLLGVAARYSRIPILPALPALASSVATAVLVAPTSSFGLIPASVVTICILLLAALRRNESNDVSVEAVRRAGQWSLTGAAIAIAIGLVAGNVLGEPRSFRDPSQQAQRDLVELDPLARFDSWVHPADGTRSLIALVEGPRALRLRLVTFDRFDGARWQLGRGVAYKTAGRTPTESTTFTSRITLEDFDEPWLAVPGTAVSVEGGDSRRRDDTGDAIVVPSPGETVAIEWVPSRSEPSAANTSPPSDTSVTPDDFVGSSADVDVWRAVVSEAANQYAGDGNAYERLQRLEAAMQTWAYDATRPPGSSYAQLGDFLQRQQTNESLHRGTSELYATAFALMARSMKFESRVVLGAQVDASRYVDRGAAEESCRGSLPGSHQVPRYPSATETTAAGDATLGLCTTDFHVWPEVKLGDEWIAFDPTPPQSNTTDRGARPTRPTKKIDDDSTFADSSLQDDASDLPPEVVIDEPPIEPDGTRAVDWRLVALGALALLLVIGLALLALWKRRQVVLLHKGDPNSRALAARDFIDRRLHEAGLRYDPTRSGSQTQRLALDRFGESVASPIGVAAPVVDAALYSPNGVDTHSADRAASACKELSAALRSRAGLIRRVAEMADPRPVFAHRKIRTENIRR